jgi:dynein heavy chain
LEAISNEICTKVRSHIQLQVIFKQPPNESIAIIKQGIAVLEKWQDQFNKTKMDIETEITIRRWDFSNIKDIFVRPKHMLLILANFNTACVVLQEFFAILGNDLKAVAGSSDPINAITDRVKDQVRKLETFNNDVFNPEYFTEWKTTFQTFQQQVDVIEVDTTHLINATFKEKLNSSEGAFELLSKFKNVKTRPRIEEELSGKYKNVLVRYKLELQNMEKLFKENHANPPIPKNMPPNSGSIAWARSIITRIKTPIDKFKTKAEILTKYDEGITSAQDYVRIAKHLTEVHEYKLFHDWKGENTSAAIAMLKKPILIKEGAVDNRKYKVNFNPQLKVIIREAKFLDRIGKEIPNTIINIALQEKDYMRHIDKLNQLLRGYNSALQNLRPVEKGLLEQNINKLNSLMDKGELNHNWFSLSIPEFIRECQDGIESFKETKGRVLQHANNIEKKVQNIENAVLVKTINFANQEIMGITEFSEYFDQHREKIIAELVKDYQNIGDTYLRSIEECTFKKNTQNCEEMRQYYYYWERRIFNAITKMIIRAMAANKALWRGKPLIKMNATYNYPEMSYHPTVEELKTQLDKFSSNILQSAKKFGRWLDGYCKIFEEQIDKDTGEKSIRYTFYDELNQNPVICNLQMEIQTLNMQIQQKFVLQAEGFFDRHFKLLYDKNELMKMQKQAEKSHSVSVIEKRLLILKKLKKQNIKLKPTHYQNSIVDVDYTDVHTNALEKIGEWWNVLGKILADIAKGTLTAIMKEINGYKDFLAVSKEGIELFKALLNKVAEIKNISMDMELKIGEAQEQFRVLKMYKYQVAIEDQELVDRIGDEWAELIETANKKDHEVAGYKQTYASITMTGVAKFKKDLAVEYEKYKANGPGTSDVSLDEGLELLQASKDLCLTFQIQKNDNLLSETLFDLEISTYPDLNDMVEKNKVYDMIYDIYKENRETVKDFSVVAWSKLDITNLTTTADKFVTMVKRLEKKLKMPQGISPFVKLQATIEGFKISIPFIQELKHPAIQERHWKRIMEETGKDLGDINLKTITLSKVFELELHLH